MAIVILGEKLLDRHDLKALLNVTDTGFYAFLKRHNLQPTTVIKGTKYYNENAIKAILQGNTAPSTPTDTDTERDLDFYPLKATQV